MLSTRYVNSVKNYNLNRQANLPQSFCDPSVEAEEHFMRSVETKMDIPESRKNDFRIELASYVGALAVEGKKFTPDCNPTFKAALEAVSAITSSYQLLIEQLCRLSSHDRDLIFNSVKELTKTVERTISWTAFLGWAPVYAGDSVREKKIISEQIITLNEEPQSSPHPKSQAIKLVFDDHTYAVIESSYTDGSEGCKLRPPKVTIYEPYKPGTNEQTR